MSVSFFDRPYRRSDVELRSLFSDYSNFIDRTKYHIVCIVRSMREGEMQLVAGSRVVIKLMKELQFRNRPLLQIFSLAVMDPESLEYDSTHSRLPEEVEMARTKLLFACRILENKLSR